jgi:hypothetical protein
MSANVLALSQENRRFLSCHGQINCKSLPPSKLSWVAPQSLWQSGAAIQMLALHRNDRREGFGRSACGPGTGKLSTYLGCLGFWALRSGKAAAARSAALSGGLDKINDRGSIALPSMCPREISR